MGSATSIPALATPSSSLAPLAPNDLIHLLERAARRLDDPDQIPRCRKPVDYVYANRDGIKNYRLVPLASSGPMVRLRLLRLNNRWDEFWNQRRQAQRWE